MPMHVYFEGVISQLSKIFHENNFLGLNGCLLKNRRLLYRFVSMQVYFQLCYLVWFYYEKKVKFIHEY